MKKAEDSPLYVAAEKGQADVTDRLLSSGDCDFVEIANYESPLHFAIRRGRREVVELILKKLAEDRQTHRENAKSGAIPVELTSDDDGCISAELIWTERITPLEISRDSNGRTPLVHAAFSTDPEIVKMLLNVAKDMYSQTDIVDSFRSIINKMHYHTVGIEDDSTFRTVLRFLMDSSKFKVNHQDEILNTFLHDVLRQDSEPTCRCLTNDSNWLRSEKQVINDVVQLLLEKGADFNLKNSFGETPLMVAAERGYCDAIQTLFDWGLKSGMKLDLDARDRYGATALIKAVQRYRVEVVRLLLKHHASLNVHDYSGHTALHAVLYDPNKNWLDFYFFCKEQSKRKFNDGNYPQIDYRNNSSLEEKLVFKNVVDLLDHCKKAARIREEIVKLLLANDETNVNAIDFRGNTPLELAVNSSEQITSATFEALTCKSRGANLLDVHVEYQTDIEVVRVDARNPFHRRNISHSFSDRRYQMLSLNHHKEMVTLLLANDQTNVNDTDFRENTPLDLTVKFSNKYISATLKSLKRRGAIHNLLEIQDQTPMKRSRSRLRSLFRCFPFSDRSHQNLSPSPTLYDINENCSQIYYSDNRSWKEFPCRNMLETEDEALNVVATVDERGRNPLHRLIIFLNSSDRRDYAMLPRPRGHCLRNVVDFFVSEILQRSEYLTKLVTDTDDQRRTPLHYANVSNPNLDLVSVLLKIGANINATDIYKKTPLHYAESEDIYKLFVQYGADEDAKDENGHTPRYLHELRKRNKIENSPGLPKSYLNRSIDITQVFSTYCVTELTRRKVVETIRINSQLIQPRESSEEAVWKIWTENEFSRLNRRLSQLNTLICQFMERVANGIGEKDGRFECQPILVGSAREETKIVISGDFDFNFKLIKLSKMCVASPHPLGPKGYFELRRKSGSNAKTSSEVDFESCFNSDQCLLTNEVNSRFQITLEEVIGLSDHDFWRNEHLFEVHMKDENAKKSPMPVNMCKTLKLRMIRPIEDGEGGFLFVNISVDIVACVDVEYDGSLSQESQPVGLCSFLNADDCRPTFVFDHPRFDPSKFCHSYFPFSETFARISFAPIESLIIQKSSTLMKAVYMVCKAMLFDGRKMTYLLKTCLLFCMEAINVCSCGRNTRNQDNNIISKKLLAFWVERLIFCCTEFCRHEVVYPCYFMPTFHQQVESIRHDFEFHESLRDEKNNQVMSYCTIYGIYLGLYPDDTAIIDIPVRSRSYALNAKYDPWLELFNREEFTRILSSRNS